ncbi:MAG: hypothetical protein KME29_18415 [Calothrix sp. FI2-JRJ7]|nr:hypothetical protein [Calothrix sp. FI2-JRJ7]
MKPQRTQRNIKSAECTQIGNYRHAITLIAFSPDGTLACGTKNGTIKLWNINTYSCIKTLNTNNGTVWRLLLVQMD